MTHGKALTLLTKCTVNLLSMMYPQEDLAFYKLDIPFFLSVFPGTDPETVSKQERESLTPAAMNQPPCPGREHSAIDYLVTLSCRTNAIAVTIVIIMVI